MDPLNFENVVAPLCIRTVSLYVLYPYSLRTLGGDSRSNLVGGESTDAVDRVRMLAVQRESTRSQYGLALSAASACVGVKGA